MDPRIEFGGSLTLHAALGLALLASHAGAQAHAGGGHGGHGSHGGKAGSGSAHGAHGGHGGKAGSGSAHAAHGGHGAHGAHGGHGAKAGSGSAHGAHGGHGAKAGSASAHGAHGGHGGAHGGGPHGGHGRHGGHGGHGGAHGGGPHGGPGGHPTHGAPTAVPEPPRDPFDGQRMLDTIRLLSSPVMAGRGSGVEGGARGAAYIAGEMMRLGLEPGFSDGSFLQRFSVIRGTELGAQNSLARVSKAPGSAGAGLSLGRDFAPFPDSSNGAVEGSLVVVGFGISAPDLEHDDYEGVEVEGKVVVAWAGDPGDDDPESPFRKPEAFRYRQTRLKAVTARDRGAAALLIVEAPGAGLATDGRGPSGSRAGIPVLDLTASAADRLLGPGVVAALRRKGGPMALRSRQVRLQVELEEVKGVAYNVLGRVRGTSPGAGQVLVGAHHDAQGLGETGSLSPDQKGQPHPGADDNASGVAAILEIAAALKAAPPKKDVWVAGFGAEEMGILGSRHLVASAPWGPRELDAMVNLDMVGRLRDDRLYVHGVDTATEWRGLVTRVLDEQGLEPGLQGDGYGPSDHTSFYAQGVPVLFCFTGPHQDYHRVSDTWDKLDPAALARAGRAIGALVRAVADLSGRPTLVAATRPPPSAGRGGGGGYGPYFGSIPDFSEHRGGVALTGVREGSPADLAGLRGGDKLVQFGDRPIQNLHDFTYALRAHRPGDRVDVWVLRGGDRVGPLEAVLGRR